MKKEVIFAIIVGFSIGLIITFGIYRAQQSYQRAQQALQNQTAAQPDSTQTDAVTPTFQVIQPENESVVSEPALIIRGLATPNAYVTAATSTTQAFAQANQAGSFSLSLNLETGANPILLTSLSDQISPETLNLLVTYQPPAAASPSAQTTPNE